METERVRSLEDVRAILDERQLSHARVGVFDIDGILRGKYMSAEKLLSAVEKGAFGFCDVVLGWDSSDLLYDNVHTAFLEDLDIVGAQHANIRSHRAAPRVDINHDSGGLQARRIIESIIADEQGGGLALAGE